MKPGQISITDFQESKLILRKKLIKHGISSLCQERFRYKLPKFDSYMLYRLLYYWVTPIWAQNINNYLDLSKALINSKDWMTCLGTEWLEIVSASHNLFRGSKRAWALTKPGFFKSLKGLSINKLWRFKPLQTISQNTVSNSFALLLPRINKKTIYVIKKNKWYTFKN